MTREEMVSVLRTLLEHYKHISLSRRHVQVRVARSTRLLRRFGVHFLTHPNDRIYLRVGERCVLNASITFESTDGLVEIGDRTYIGNDTHIISRSRVRIGNDVDHFYRTYGTDRCFNELDWSDVKAAPIVISDRVWIGFGAVILKGVTIGEGAIIGACSVVSGDVEPYAVVAGNPAVQLRRIQPPAQDSSPDAVD
jgi:acetyltransferase-like isoleucine patch superfamily enzyme